ncbi:MAG: hypothetical protein NT164_03400 [Verrucomicrobiae bacterium]|nr:hypothetical protein [Verrucomicrobiae bacterium]
MSGLLEEEVQALLQRFHQLQQHIIAVEKKHSLIDVWNEKTFQEQLRLKDNYLYREWNRLYQKVMASSRCDEFLSCLYHLRKINGL